MEDDCNFEYVKYQNYSIKELIKLMDKQFPNWEVLQLATCNRADRDIAQSKDKYYIRPKNKNCATSYLINKKAINKNILIQNLTIQQSENVIYKQFLKHFT